VALFRTARRAINSFLSLPPSGSTVVPIFHLLCAPLPRAAVIDGRDRKEAKSSCARFSAHASLVTYWRTNPCRNHLIITNQHSYSHTSSMKLWTENKYFPPFHQISCTPKLVMNIPVVFIHSLVRLFVHSLGYSTRSHLQPTLVASQYPGLSVLPTLTSQLVLFLLPQRIWSSMFQLYDHPFNGLPTSVRTIICCVLKNTLRQCQRPFYYCIHLFLVKGVQHVLNSFIMFTFDFVKYIRSHPLTVFTNFISRKNYRLRYALNRTIGSSRTCGHQISYLWIHWQVIYRYGKEGKYASQRYQTNKIFRGGLNIVDGFYLPESQNSNEYGVEEGSKAEFFRTDLQSVNICGSVCQPFLSHKGTSADAI
jgi:hypothetical protein